MQPEIYMLALDVIEHAGKIQILEVQNAYASNVERVIELTGYDPIRCLTALLTKKFPGLEISIPNLPESLHRDARLASVAGNQNTFPNRGIESQILFKWFFNAICNENSALRKFVPETTIATLASVEAVFEIEKLQAATYLFKPYGKCGGVGVKKIPPVPSFGELKHWLNYQIEHPQEPIFTHTPFLLQKYLERVDNNIKKPLPVIRIFVAVAWDYQRRELSIYPATELAYEHNRIHDNDNDFTLGNNTHNTCQANHLKQLIAGFFKHFFSYLLAGRSKVTYKYWEVVAKRYIQNHKKMPASVRMHLLGIFVVALALEQEFTNNRLTHYQCFILQALLECYQKSDMQAALQNQLAQIMVDGFLVLLNHNLNSYATDLRYPLHTVLMDFHKIHDLRGCPARFFPMIKKIQNVPTVSFFKTSRGPTYLDYCDRQDINDFSATSRDNLKKVATYARW
jgi:hypothetical protein